MPTILITGTNRGLGLEFTKQYLDAEWQVLACCRQPERASDLEALADLHPNLLTIHPLDVSDFAQIDQLADQLGGEKIDVLLNNAGIFGPKISENDNRQTFGSIDYEIWLNILRTNTLAPMRMAEAFVEHVAASEIKKIVVISSDIGSIGNADGQYYAYGSSKAAVSKAYANLAVDLQDRGIGVGVFCPGWVPTEMGGPQGHVAIEDSIAGLRARIDEIRPGPIPSFRRYNNDLLKW